LFFPFLKKVGTGMESFRKARGFDVSALQAKNGLDRQQMKSAANGTGCHLESCGGPKSSRVFSGPWTRSISNVPGWVGAVGLSVILLVFLIPLWMSSPAISQMTPDMKEALDLHKAGKVKEALDLYSDVIKKNPRSAEAFNWRGMAYDDLGQLDKALADYSKAIDLNPDYADAYNNRGEIYRKQKKYAEAMANYKKAAQLEKGFAEAHYNMALIFELQKHYDQAAAQYGLYLRLRPNAPDKQQVAGKIQMLRRQMAQARVAGRPPAPGQPSAAPGKPPTGPRPPALAQVKPGAKPALPKFGPPGIPGVQQGPNVLEIPGLGPIQIPTDPAKLQKLAAQFNVASTIMSALWYIFVAVMLYLIATKTGTSLAWLAFIPIANIVLAVRIARKPLWWLLLIFFLPVLAAVPAFLLFVDPTGGIIVSVLSVAILLAWLIVLLLIAIGIARARRKSVIWGILLFIPCLNVIALAYLGLSR
jgi:tetratricopeptide (TPR) repeat protein